MILILKKPLNPQYVDALGMALVEHDFEYVRQSASSNKAKIIDKVSSHTISFYGKDDSGYHMIEVDQELLEFNFLYLFLPKELAEPLMVVIKQSKEVTISVCRDVLCDSKKSSAKLADRALAFAKNQRKIAPPPLSLPPALESDRKNLPGSLALRHFKIWFSRQEEGPPLDWSINEERLVTHQNIFKELGGTLSLISNYEDFPESKKEALMAFCKKYDIRLKSLTSIFDEICLIPDQVDREMQLQLFYIAGLEINNKYGNFAAASDIMRILDPCIQLGVYSDFDFEITEKIYQAIKQSSLKLNIKFSQKLKFSQSYFIENEIELVENHFLLCDQNHRDFLRNYRKGILDSYLDLNDIVGCLRKNIIYYHRKGIIVLPGLEKHLDTIKMRAIHAGKEMSPHAGIIYFRYQLNLLLTEKAYQDSLLISVLYMSGPNCATYVFEQYIKQNPINLDEVVFDDLILPPSDCAWLRNGREQMNEREKKYADVQKHMPALQAHEQEPSSTSNEIDVSEIKNLFEANFKKNSLKLTSTHLVIIIHCIWPPLYIEDVNGLVEKLQELQCIDQRFKSAPEITSANFLELRIPLEYIKRNPKIEVAEAKQIFEERKKQWGAENLPFFQAKPAPSVSISQMKVTPDSPAVLPLVSDESQGFCHIL